MTADDRKQNADERANLDRKSDFDRRAHVNRKAHLDPVEPDHSSWDRVAGGYNDPPAVPREEIWARVRKELHRAGALNADSGSARRRGSARTPSRLPRRAFAWAAAAALFLFLGVGIGRELGNGPPGELPGETAEAPVAGEAGGGTVQRAASTGGERAADTGPVSPAATDLPPGRPAARGRSLQVAATDFLSASETLLAMVRSDARQGRLEPEIGGWARSLLTETRLLMDSPVSADPEMALLLGELELTLIQVVQAARIPDTDSARSSREIELLTTRLESSNMAPRIEAMTPVLTNGDGS